jgi:hypothetical protein
MDFLVEFLESGGARIIKDALLVEKKKNFPNVLLNPDISHLKGISPSFWIKDGSVIDSHPPDVIEKQVRKSLSDYHPFSTQQEVEFSPDSKFISKIDEINSKREQDIHNLLKSFSGLKREIDCKIEELEDKLKVNLEDFKNQKIDAEEQLKDTVLNIQTKISSQGDVLDEKLKLVSEKLDQSDAASLNITKKTEDDKKRIVSLINSVEERFSFVTKDLDFKIKKNNDKANKLFFIYILVIVLLKLL